MERYGNCSSPTLASSSQLTLSQIEKFIESIFPSQTARTLKPGFQAGDVTKPALTPEQEAKKAADEKEAKQDIIMIAIAVGCTLAFITLCMVSTYTETSVCSDS